MKKFLILLLILSILKANSQNISLKITGEIPSVTNGEQAVAKVADGYFVCNSLENKQGSLKLIKISTTGNISWSKLYKFPESEYTLAVQQLTTLSDGGIIISGNYNLSESFLLKINSSGEIIWSESFKSDTRYTCIRELPDSSLLLAYSSQLDLALVRLNRHGDVISSSLLNVNSEWLHDIKIHDKSLSIVTGQGTVINMDLEAEKTNWMRQYYSELGFTMNTCANGDFIFSSVQKAFSGNLAIYRTDKNGSLKWAKEVVFRNNSPRKFYFDHTGLHMIAEDSKGNIRLFSNSEGGSVGSLLVTLDSAGNYLSNIKINSTQNVISEVSREGYVLSGFIRNQNPAIFQVRKYDDLTACDSVMNPFIHQGTDSLTSLAGKILTSEFTPEKISLEITSETGSESAELFCNTVITAEIRDKNISETDIYPNPCSSVLNIKTTSPADKIQVFDNRGDLVISMKGDNSEININTLETGLYLCIIHNGNTVISRKFIKE